MIQIKRVCDLDGSLKEVHLEGEDVIIDAEEKLTLLPALTSAFCSLPYQEAVTAALEGGITFFFGEEKGEFSPRYYLPTTNLAHLPSLAREIAGIHCAVNALPDDLNSLFSLAAQYNALIAFHRLESDTANPKIIEKLLTLAKKYDTTTYFFPIKSLEELALIQKARQEELLVYTELSPSSLGQSWWDALHAGTIDSVGCHAQPQLTLPHLLNANHQGNLPLEKIVELTSLNVQRIFNIEAPQDFVLVDLKETRDNLTGWPSHTFCRGHLYSQ